MTFSFLNSMLQRVSASPLWPWLFYAATWTALLLATVTVASFSSELAFVSAIKPSSSFSRGCQKEYYQSVIRVPLDVPGEVFCLPAHMFLRSNMDFLAPLLFTAVIVACSAYVVRSLALWEVDVETN